ncbi:MerR family transcriptional regulator [Paenibacillus sp. LHD-38]|uniref:MerR family transcriptional regulator n=1 Tax=Paenibacillus sp. LHD-38 TaxID=3072143 RepID=UPI00280C5FDB|nr:MerR family transcriptional regulator [Paenibacillus sp. LHD-38]MDQ8735814.1 MerR family transcriptional regulator [Paenibacillus sp. LHD-38]
MAYYTAKQLSEILQEHDEGMNLRTVRYYTQIGLVPPLELVGNKRVYTVSHLDYFRAIRTLSKAGESLQVIQEKLGTMPIEEIRKIGELMPFYQPNNDHETVKVNDDVLITLSPRISVEIKERVINSVAQILKGGSTE